MKYITEVPCFRYLRSQSSDEAPEEALASCLLREAVSEAAEDVVREVVQELAEDHLQKASAYDVAVDVMNEFISDIGSELVRHGMILQDIFVIIE